MTSWRGSHRLAALFGLAMIFLCAALRADDWPQWRGTSRDGVWRETGIVEKFDKPQIDIAWRAKIGGGYSIPSVADGRVYVTDRLTKPNQVERIHCFEEKTGKPIWSPSYDCVYRDVGYETGPRGGVCWTHPAFVNKHVFVRNDEEIVCASLAAK